MKKTVIGIVVILVIIIAALYWRNSSMSPVATADTSFEDDAAAILSSKVTPQQKLANLQANLDARKAARATRAAKNGTTSR